jgi:glycosidase
MINDTLLLESLHNFFSSPYNRDKLISVLSDDKRISLRSIDWFITNFSKKNNTYYLIYNDENGNPSFDDKNNEYRINMNVFHSYKSQLKAYSKKRFDPFCRRDRLLFEMDGGHSVETTIGQLNFFKWAISNMVVDYIGLYKDEIEYDMNTSLKLMKENSDKKAGSRKKRQELSLSATRGLKMNRVPIEITFD